MGWFTEEPHELFQAIPTAVNSWWDSIDNVPDGQFIEIRMSDDLTIFLFGTDEQGREEYRKRHGDRIKSTAGTFLSMGGKDKSLWKYEAWVPYKITPAGNRITPPWAGGHEVVGHYLHAKYGFGDPDRVDKAEFYTG